MDDQLHENVVVPGPPSNGAKVFFWIITISWVGLCILTATMVPLLDAIQPSLETGLLISILIPAALLIAANISALYPVLIAKHIRSNTLIRLAWILSIVVALLGDLAFLWGIVRLLVFGPTIG